MNMILTNTKIAKMGLVMAFVFAITNNTSQAMVATDLPAPYSGASLASNRDPQNINGTVLPAVPEDVPSPSGPTIFCIGDGSMPHTTLLPDDTDDNSTNDNFTKWGVYQQRLREAASEHTTELTELTTPQATELQRQRQEYGLNQATERRAGLGKRPYDGGCNIYRFNDGFSISDMCLIASTIARVLFLEIDQQVRRLGDKNGRLAGLTGASLAASRIINDVCRISKNDGIVCHINSAAWVAADGADFIERVHKLLFGNKQDVKNLNKNKKTNKFKVDEEEYDNDEEKNDNDDDDNDKKVKHSSKKSKTKKTDKNNSAEKTNNLTSALSAITPTLEAIIVSYMAARLQSDAVRELPVPRIVIRHLNDLLSLIRAAEMYSVSDSGSYKKKLAYLLGCMAIVKAIWSELFLSVFFVFDFLKNA